MKRGILLLALVAGLAGCAHGHYVMAPDGQPATMVTCHHRHQHSCYAKAQRICPWGFQVLDAPYGSLMFRCGPSAPEPTAPAPDEGQEQSAPTAPNTTPPVPEERLYRT